MKGFKNMREECFSCNRDNRTIRGMQYYPEDYQEGQKYPGVIVSHGFMGHCLDMAGWCRDFARIGYMAFGFNFCGGARSVKDDALQSDGKSTEMNISTEIADLLAVIGFVKGQPSVDTGDLILMGESQGGFVSGLAAAKCGSGIKKLIMIFPALCIPDHARQGHLGGSSYRTDNVPEILDCGHTLLGRAFHEDVAGMDPYLGLSAYEGPVLLLQGLEDPVVNYSYAIRAKENYREGQCHLQIIRDMGHGLTKEQHDSAFSSIRYFLAGREEILTIRIIITHSEEVPEGEVRRTDLYFTGYCETGYFQGVVLPGGCDARRQYPDGETKVRAEYTLDGLDRDGEKCHIHIVNQWGGNDWKPVIETDSAALDWLNRADLTAVVEGGKGGPTIRIFADAAETDQDKIYNECDPGAFETGIE
ncbi:MAG: alpha/beta hydrolase [Eubacterium sp.]|nr:alpha/beta hydrolase [Eubacterium sp.]MCM1213111.1 alpha/beta hydrolase [Lachnospiraceae bacterium]MCM1305099.1 alpha/beta hydrolase [Butyrivibrio sp.]MCM1345296.1 alpha/beta hydrolase [Muribaculaceae bacterium]MCM1239416.1 alpha/beta hydrolase [Lachnospiraceae bacterium]